MLISGQVDMKTFGPAKVFFISKRVPIHQLLDLSSELIMILDHDLFVRHVNNRMLDVFSLRREDLVIHHIDHTLIGASISPVFRQRIREGENGNECDLYEKIDINGHLWHFYAKCVPVVFEEGQRGVSVILRDISVSKTHT